MQKTMEDLWRSTDRAHSQIQIGHFALHDIAESVRYLHPDMSDRLIKISNSIESARCTIQHNAAEMVNNQIRQSQQASGDFLVALLNRGGRENA